MASLEAKLEFDEAIREIHILIDSAIENETITSKYATFNKAAIVLLCGKFESFLETFLEEYGYIHLTRSSNKTLPQAISNHIVDNIINRLEYYKNNKLKRAPFISELVMLCGDEEVSCSDFRIDSSFNYGKHGQKEVIRLLNCFGFEQFVNTVETTDFFSRFNSLNNIRNNILHQDSTPSLTHVDVNDFLNSISEFVLKIDLEAQELLI